MHTETETETDTKRETARADNVKKDKRKADATEAHLPRWNEEGMQLGGSHVDLNMVTYAKTNMQRFWE